MSRDTFVWDNKELLNKYPKALDVLLDLFMDYSKITFTRSGIDFDIEPDTYDDLDEWFREEFQITPEQFYDTKNYFEELLKSAKYYKDDSGEVHIELSDFPILNQINSEIDEIAWSDLVEDYIEEFENQTRIKVFILGRSGRHVCVELNVDNLIKFNELKTLVEKLQKELIDAANNYSTVEESFGYDTSVDDPEIYEIDASLNDDINFDKKIVNREELFDFVNKVADLYNDDAPENEILAISTFLGDYNIYISVTESMTLDEDIEDDNIYALARDLANLYKDYDIYEFRDCYDSDEEAIFEIASTIKDENVDNIFMYLNYMIDNEAGELKTEAENLISRLKTQLNINECLTEDIDDEDEWIEVKSKNVFDTDGFMTDYTMYKNSDGTKYIFMFGDKDVYEPDEDYADWECETEEEANEWFDSYGKEEDDFDEDWEDDDFDSYLEGEDDSQEWLNDPDIGIFGFADEPLEEDINPKFKKFYDKIAKDKKLAKEIDDIYVELLKRLGYNEDEIEEELERSITDKIEDILENAAIISSVPNKKLAAELNALLDESVNRGLKEDLDLSNAEKGHIQHKINDIEFIMDSDELIGSTIKSINKINSITYELIDYNDNSIIIKFDPTWSEWVFDIDGEGPFSYGSYEYIIDEARKAFYKKEFDSDFNAVLNTLKGEKDKHKISDYIEDQVETSQISYDVYDALVKYFNLNESLNESVTTAPIATYYVSGDLGIIIYNINHDIDDEVVWAWSNTPDEIETSIVEYEYGDNEYDSRAFFMADDEKVYLDDCLRSFNESKHDEIDNKSLIENNDLDESYGGAYDIDENEYFTKEEITDFAEAVKDEVEKDAINSPLTVTDVYTTNNNFGGEFLTIFIEDFEGNEYDYDVRIDMRKIKKPSDLYKYKDEFVNHFYNQFCLEEAELDESLDEVDNYESVDESIELNEDSKKPWGEKAYNLNEIISSMNNEGAYYETGWLYVWPDGDTLDDACYDFETKKEYQELEDLFKRVYRKYHKDGLYTKSSRIVDMAHAWDEKLGLPAIENFYEELN